MPGTDDSDFEQLDRPHKMEPAPGLTEAHEVPEWKKPDMGEDMENWETELPAASTDFTTPTHLNDEDWT